MMRPKSPRQSPKLLRLSALSQEVLRNLGRALACAIVSVLILTPVLITAGPLFPEFVDPNPNPGNQFGHTVVPLSTGNVVITSPFDDTGATDAGAVYLFNGATGALISRLTGASANDNVGLHGVTALPSGNFVVASLLWDNGTKSDAGAVTWGHGVTGVTGIVGVGNSLVGSSAYDNVGRLTVLGNGNYLVSSMLWDNGSTANAGAVTWGLGNSGIRGPINSTNSLVGSKANDPVGSRGVTALRNSHNYLVHSPDWNNGSVKRAGALTWGNGLTGTRGVVSTVNSLVGSSTWDLVGYDPVVTLAGGDYVVRTWTWDRGSAGNAGASTWGSGKSGVAGVISSSNSLIGGSPGDQVGVGVVELTNGNYLVLSPAWTGSQLQVGAVTWARGHEGVRGEISTANSLVGTNQRDRVGAGGVALSNGNFVVASPFWNSGAGAATWINGALGVTGTVSTDNSLIGPTALDYVGSQILPLSNGNYVVLSSRWKNGGNLSGAVTWADGSTGLKGVVSVGNSLIGSRNGDTDPLNQEYQFRMQALSNGNYVVFNPAWGDGSLTNLGAVTWGNGTVGTRGVVSHGNSLIGATEGDRVGSFVIALPNGNYVVSSTQWHNSARASTGAVTWGNGTSGTTGVVSSANSLVGSTANDRVGEQVMLLRNGNYVVVSPLWAHGTAKEAGAVTWGNGATGIRGVLSSANSFVGGRTGDRLGSITDEPLASGLAVLSNGNYLVAGGYWDNGSLNDAGIVMWGSGMAGLAGVADGTKSLAGLTPAAGLQPIIEDELNGTYCCRFLTEIGGKVRIGSIYDGLAVTTPIIVPVPSIKDILSESASLGGKVRADGGSPVLERGIVFSVTSINPDPAIGGTGVTQIQSQGSTGEFAISATGLSGGTNYTFKAYATNSIGTAYSDSALFSTPRANLPPTFRVIAFSTTENTTVTIQAASILARAADSDGGSPSLSHIASVTSQGGSVVTTGNELRYAPFSGFTGLDFFNVTISDGQGGSTVGSVIVSVQKSAQNQPETQMTLQPDGRIAILFVVVPGAKCTIERSSDLRNWTALSTATSRRDGVVPFVDNHLFTRGRVFYRCLPAPD